MPDEARAVEVETKKIYVRPNRPQIDFDACINPEAGFATYHDMVTAILDKFPNGAMIDLEAGTIAPLGD